MKVRGGRGIVESGIVDQSSRNWETDVCKMSFFWCKFCIETLCALASFMLSGGINILYDGSLAADFTEDENVLV